MSNFKSGSGNLDFGSTDDDETSTEEQSEPTSSEGQASTGSPTTEDASEAGETADQQDSSAAEEASQETSEETESTEVPTTVESTTSEYPYFVRRSNVGDERDTRLEIHVRDKVADQEAAFRSDVANHLDVTEISKTDAREFALLAAYEYPEKVAELMEDEGFGTL